MPWNLGQWPLSWKHVPWKYAIIFKFLARKALFHILACHAACHTVLPCTAKTAKKVNTWTVLCTRCPGIWEWMFVLKAGTLQVYTAIKNLRITQDLSVWMVLQKALWVLAIVQQFHEMPEFTSLFAMLLVMSWCKRAVKQTTLDKTNYTPKTPDVLESRTMVVAFKEGTL